MVHDRLFHGDRYPNGEKSTRGKWISSAPDDEADICGMDCGADTEKAQRDQIEEVVINTRLSRREILRLTRRPADRLPIEAGAIRMT